MSTPLRKAMQRDMELKGLAESTQSAYIYHVRRFAEYHGKSPEVLGTEEIKEYLYYLIKEEKRRGTYVNYAYSALKFLYVRTLEREWSSAKIPRLKKERILPSVLSQSEVQDLFNAVENIKHKAILMTIYAAGLRVSEAANLKLADIDSKNMQIHVSLGKGKKDRYCILSKKNLEILREYFEEYKPKEWLFPNKNTGKPISTRTIQRVFDKAYDKSGIKKKATVHTLRHYVESNIMGSNLGLR